MGDRDQFAVSLQKPEFVTEHLPQYRSDHRRARQCRQTSLAWKVDEWNSANFESEPLRLQHHLSVDKRPARLQISGFQKAARKDLAREVYVSMRNTEKRSDQRIISTRQQQPSPPFTAIEAAARNEYGFVRS